MQERFFSYKHGVRDLLRRLEEDHPCYREVLVLQARLLENLAYTRRLGNNNSLRSDRVQILDALNEVALEVMSVSFNELSGLDREIEEPLADSIDLEHLLSSLLGLARRALLPMLVLTVGWAAIALLFHLMIIPSTKTVQWSNTVRIVS